MSHRRSDERIRVAFLSAYSPVECLQTRRIGRSCRFSLADSQGKPAAAGHLVTAGAGETSARARGPVVNKAIVAADQGDPSAHPLSLVGEWSAEKNWGGYRSCVPLAVVMAESFCALLAVASGV
jgi:hypothetical protein